MARRRRGRSSNQQQIQRHVNTVASPGGEEDDEDQDHEESLDTSEEIDAESNRNDDVEGDDDEDVPVPEPQMALVRSSRCTGRGGGRRGKRVVNVTQQPRSYGEEGLGDLQVVVDGIQETMKGLVQCASSSLSGFKEFDETPEYKNEKQDMMKKYLDTAIAITETQEKLKVLPSAAAAAFDDVELGTIGEGMEDDEQFFEKLDQYEEAAKEEGIKRCESIGINEVNANPMYQYFVKEINKFVDRAPKKSGEPDDGEMEIATTSRGSKRTGTAQQSDENSFSEGLQLLTEYIPTTDPITRKPLKNPVVNRKCNHVYENDSITGMMVSAGTRITRCPYPGCYNKSPITMEDLYKDKVLARKIAEKIKEGVCE